MSGHTPGPWKTGWLESYNAMTGEPVAYVYRSDAETADTRICIRTVGDLFDVDADAKLIAAAPDLLEALKGAISTLASMNWANRSDNVLTRAKAAIAKAEGPP